MTEILENNMPDESGEIIVAKRFRAFKRFAKNRPALISSIFMIISVIVCLFPSYITGYEQNAQFDDKRAFPSSKYLLGTTVNGNDLLTELLYAMQVTLRIAIGVAIVSTIIGAFVGAIAAYAGGFIDSLLMRSTDLFLVVPQVIILSIGLSKFGTSGDIFLILIISLTMWMYIARLVRSQVLSLKEREYVDAAKISGHGFIYIVVKHLIRNAVSLLAVSAAITVSAAIILESTVSFLGFGVKSPRTSLGLMLIDADTSSSGLHPIDFYAPGLAIFLIVLAVNFISDGLRDALDPETEKL